MKWENQHSLRGKLIRNLTHKLKDEELEYPTCFGYIGGEGCLHGYEVIAGWAGEPGSYEINCYMADECKDRRDNPNKQGVEPKNKAQFLEDVYKHIEDMFERHNNPTSPRNKMHKKRFDNCEYKDECKAHEWSRCTQLCWASDCIANRRSK